MAPNATTSKRTSEIISSGSPLMKQAETRAKQYAQERGLLNSSIAVGAAHGAVLDRSTDIARADVEDEIRNFHAQMDLKKFDADSSYREKALAQELKLSNKRMALEAELGRGGLGVEKRRIGLQEELGRKGQTLAERKVALEEKLGLGSLGVEKRRIGLQEELGRKGQTLAERKVALEEKLGLGSLGVEKRRIGLQEELGRKGQTLAERKVALEEKLGLGGLSVEQRKVSLQEELGRAETALKQFYAGLDRERFDSDSAYRQQALDQESRLKGRQLDIQEYMGEEGIAVNRERLDLDTELGRGSWVSED